MKPYICPVCNGHGIVPGGFYYTYSNAPSTTANCTTETCRACGGKGILWGTDNSDSNVGFWELMFEDE